MPKLYNIFNTIKFVITLLLLPFFASSQFGTQPIGGTLYGEQIIAGPMQLTSGCGNRLNSQRKFVATAKSIYQADKPTLPNVYSKKWSAPAGTAIANINIKKQVSSDSCWTDFLLILLNNGGVYIYNTATGNAVYYGQAGSGAAQTFFKIGGDNIYVLSSNYLYETKDSGAQWIVDTAGLNGAAVNDFAVDSSEHIYAATNLGIFTMLPSDTAWTFDTSFTGLAYVGKIFIDRSNRIFVAGGGNGLIYANFPDSAGWFADSTNFGPYVVKEFADDIYGNIYALANTPFTSTGDKIYISDSGTGIWQEIDGTLSLLNTYPVFINSISGDSVLNLGTNFGVYISPDFGNTWTGNNSGIQAEDVLGLVKLQNDRLVIAASLGVYAKNSSDTVWQKTYPTGSYGNNLSLYSDSVGDIYMLDPNITPYLQQAIPVLKSTDGGTTWQGDTVGLSSVPGDYYYVDETGAQHYGNTFYSGTVYTLLWAKPAGGIWVQDTAGFPVSTNSAITAMASDGGGYLYLSGYLRGGGVWRRPIATGSKWEPDTTGLNFPYVSGFYQMAGGKGRIVGSTTYQIYIKIDSNWSGVSFPDLQPGAVVNAISVDKTGTIFASFTNATGTGAGVYFTKDTGLTWLPVGLDSLDVSALVSYTDTVYALTSAEWAYMIALSGNLGINQPTVNVQPVLKSYPEPFNSILSIHYTLAVQSSVNIKVYDMTWREVSTLENETHQAGTYILNWNAAALPEGVYFCRMYARGVDGSEYSEAAKLVHIK